MSFHPKSHTYLIPSTSKLDGSRRFTKEPEKTLIDKRFSRLYDAISNQMLSKRLPCESAHHAHSNSNAYKKFEHSPNDLTSSFKTPTKV